MGKDSHAAGSRQPAAGQPLAPNASFPGASTDRGNYNVKHADITSPAIRSAADRYADLGAANR